MYLQGVLDLTHFCFTCHSLLTVINLNYVHYELSQFSDSIGAGSFGNRILAKTKIFALVQTGPGIQLASYTKGIGFVSRGQKEDGAWW